jgi:hypothetical protein
MFSVGLEFCFKRKEIYVAQRCEGTGKAKVIRGGAYAERGKNPHAQPQERIVTMHKTEMLLTDDMQHRIMNSSIKIRPLSPVSACN